MPLTVLVLVVLAFGLGTLFGAFVLRRNPLKGAKTLDDLENAYKKTKADLLAKLRK